MKRIRFFVAAAFLITATAGMEGCQSAKSSTATKLLRFNLENNKGYDYELTMNMDQDIMGQALKMDLVTYYSMNVAGGENEDKNISTSIDRFKMKTSIAGFNIDVDTDEPAPGGDPQNPLDMLNKVFGAIKGQTFSMKVTPEGNITEVKGFETLGMRLADSLGFEGEKKEMMMKQLNGRFNADEIRQSLGRFWYIFPNKEVKVGDTWTKSSELGGNVPAKYISNYKVTDIEGDMVTLEENTKIQTKEEGKEVSGKVTGSMVVDSRSGLVVTADQEMTINATENGKTVEIKVTSKLKGKAR